MTGNLRLLIVSVALLLVLLSIPPLRRRLPGVRALPPALEPLLWVAFLFLCLVAITSVHGLRANELRQAIERASLVLAGQTLGAVLGPPALWTSSHQPGLALVSVAAVGLGWVLVAARAATIFGRSLTPHPRLGDWWVLDFGSRAADPSVSEAPPRPVTPAAFMDVHAAALYLGVSRATVYRWHRVGRLPSSPAGKELRFSPDDLAILRHRRHRSSHGRQSRLAR